MLEREVITMIEKSNEVKSRKKNIVCEVRKKIVENRDWYKGIPYMEDAIKNGIENYKRDYKKLDSDEEISIKVEKEYLYTRLSNDLNAVEAHIKEYLYQYDNEEIQKFLEKYFYTRSNKELADIFFRGENTGEFDNKRNINAHIKSGKSYYNYEEFIQKFTDRTLTEEERGDLNTIYNSLEYVYKNIVCTVTDVLTEKKKEKIEKVMLELEKWKDIVSTVDQYIQKYVVELEHPSLQLGMYCIELIVDSVRKISKYFSFIGMDVIKEDFEKYLNDEKNIKKTIYPLAEHLGACFLRYVLSKDREVKREIIKCLLKEKIDPVEDKYNVLKQKITESNDNLKEYFVEKNTTLREEVFKQRLGECKEVMNWFRDNHPESRNMADVVLLKAIYRELYILKAPCKYGRGKADSFIKKVTEGEFDKSLNMIEKETMYSFKISRGIAREAGIYQMELKSWESDLEYFEFEDKLMDIKHMEGDYLTCWMNILSSKVRDVSMILGKWLMKFNGETNQII